MNDVLVERSPSPGKIEVLGADSWPLKKLAAGQYTRTYATSEECYIAEGKAVLSCGRTIEAVAAGDLVFIPQGLTVTWEVPAEIEYHWRACGGT